MPQIPLDLKAELTVCDCQFTPYEDNFIDGESWHYLRKCVHCGEEWYSLHCPHDGFQGYCPNCKERAQQVEETAFVLNGVRYENEPEAA